MIRTNTIEDKIRNELTSFALLQHHKPYEHGSRGLDTFDCAGLVWSTYYEVFKIMIYHDGFGLSTTTKIMTNSYGKLTLFKKTSSYKDLSLVKKGDILFFHRQSLDDDIPKKYNFYPGHCGIYLGDYKFIHALSSVGKVVISDFNKNQYWLNVLVGSKDIVSDIKVLKKRF